MANLSDDDRKIIEEHPLGNTLDRLRDALQNAEQSYDAASGEPDIRAQKAISRLLSTLLGHEVALDLRSQTSNQNVASELATLFGRIQNRDFNYEYYRSLVRLVLEKKSDTEIWSAVINFITTISRASPPASIPPSFDGTPIRYSSASQQGGEQTREEVDPWIFEEIQSCTHRGVDGFFEKYFDGLDWTERTKDIYHALKNRHVDGKWTDFPDVPVQDAVLEWFFGLQSEFLSDAKGFYCTSESSKDLTGAEARRQLDLFIKPQDVKKANAVHNWKDVNVIGELRASNHEWKKKFLQLGRYMRDVYTTQPIRRFMHGFTLLGTAMELWVFDRSGPYSSKAFDINNEPEKFIRAMAGYALMSDKELGLDTFIEEDKGDRFIRIINEATGEEQRLKLELDPVAIQRAIVCRGTCCFRATVPGVKSQYVVKFSWTSDQRPPEADLLRLARKRGVKGIAQLYGHKKIATIAEMRKGLTFTKTHTFRSPASSPLASFSQSQQRAPHSRSFSQLQGLSIAEGPSRKRKSVDAGRGSSKRSRSNSQRANNVRREDEVTYAVEDTKPTSLLVDNQDPFDNRIFRCLVIFPAGTVIRHFRSRCELLEALRDAIKAHRSLLMDGKILHRDISENNIIIPDDPKEVDDFAGILIDMDLAKELDSEPSGARHRTGTMEFMAIEVLLGYSHTYRHDLESFFYVLLWVCARHGWDFVQNPKGRAQESFFEGWYKGNYENIANTKRGNMDKQGLERMLMEFPPEFDSIKPLCRTIRDILFPYRDGLFIGTPTDPKLLYEPIITAFDDVIASLPSE